MAGGDQGLWAPRSRQVRSRSKSSSTAKAVGRGGRGEALLFVAKVLPVLSASLFFLMAFSLPRPGRAGHWGCRRGHQDPSILGHVKLRPPTPAGRWSSPDFAGTSGACGGLLVALWGCPEGKRRLSEKLEPSRSVTVSALSFSPPPFLLPFAVLLSVPLPQQTGSVWCGRWRPASPGVLVQSDCHLKRRIFFLSRLQCSWDGCRDGSAGLDAMLILAKDQRLESPPVHGWGGGGLSRGCTLTSGHRLEVEVRWGPSERGCSLEMRRNTLNASCFPRVPMEPDPMDLASFGSGCQDSPCLILLNTFSSFILHSFPVFRHTVLRYGVYLENSPSHWGPAAFLGAF